MLNYFDELKQSKNISLIIDHIIFFLGFWWFWKIARLHLFDRKYEN